MDMEAADTEGWLYYSILYKGVEYVWIFVFRGSWSQSPTGAEPSLREDDCILCDYFAPIFSFDFSYTMMF